ncbi:MAG: AEC family transporter [Arcobacteraceae bacterium]|nr:AEC family transporter [Arcobacteraceae bacterium]
MGFIAKKLFKDEIDERSLVLISIYFLQPILTFWGLTRVKMDYTLVYTPFLYCIIITIALLLNILIAKQISKDTQEQSIFIVASLIGNTGNLGIPLGIALFGEQSVAYTSIINIANIFFIYTVGIYFYAKSKFSLYNALKNILKIPILWFALFALIANWLQVPIHPQLDLLLQMGAYSTIVIQLIIFGIYLSGVKISAINYRLTFFSSFVKLISLPLLGWIILSYFDIDNFIISILLMQLLVPLAVNNVNIASLYDCKTYDVTIIIVFSSIIFIPIILLFTAFLGI